MFKMMTHISVFLLLGFLVFGLGNCNDSPVRHVETNTCWKPLTPLPPGSTVETHATNAVWSPSGKYVAFLGGFDSCNNDNLAVYITESGGKSRRSLGFVGAVIRWLPPGDSVLIVNDGFFGAGQLFKFNINTMVKTPLGIQTRLPPFDVSGNGRFIYYEGPKLDSTSAGGIYRYSLESGETVTITPGGNPAVSPDGNLVALSKGPLFVYDLISGALQQLYDRGRVPDWTPDGNWVVTGDNARFEIRKSDLRGNSELPTKGFGAPNVSPDGNWVLYQNISSDNYDGVWIVRIDGSGAHEYIE